MAGTNTRNTLNGMRSVFLAARENGNKKAITQAMAAEEGVSEAVFNWYKAEREDLLKAAYEYIRLKNSPTATEEQKNVLMQVLGQKWHKFLGTGEETDTIRELRYSEHDVSNLVAYGQQFFREQNNVENEKGFKTTLAFATQPAKNFYRSVETDLGIRIAGIEVMSDERRSFLQQEGKHMAAINNANKVIGIKKRDLGSAKKMFELGGGKGNTALVEFYEAQKTALSDDIKRQENKKAKAEYELGVLRGEFKREDKAFEYPNKDVIKKDSAKAQEAAEKAGKPKAEAPKASGGNTPRRSRTTSKKKEETKAAAPKAPRGKGKGKGGEGAA